MIIIFSNQDDVTTHRLLDRLRNYNVEYVMVYPETAFKLISLSIGDFIFQVEGKTIQYSTLSGMWKRRGFIPSIWDFSSIKHSNLPASFKTKYLKNLSAQQKALKDYMRYLFDQLPCINKIANAHVNKFIMLQKAEEVGFKIPDTLVTNRSDEVQKWFREEKLIVKSIDRTFIVRDNGYSYGHHTQALKKSDLSGIENMGYATFQTRLSKLFELRVFHIWGQNYAMAIFSQLDEQTTVDFRNYNYEKPNRCAPFNLPKTVDDQINSFMKSVDLNCGSLDIVVTAEGQYVFLEVNPLGQWDVLTADCNYPLYDIVAKKLKSFYDSRNN